MVLLYGYENGDRNDGFFCLGTFMVITHFLYLLA